MGQGFIQDFYLGEIGLGEIKVENLSQGDILGVSFLYKTLRFTVFLCILMLSITFFKI